ncbi:Ribosomal protein S18 acetylase RimI [Halobacillus karajensis]|uniref:Ribosomal-protein-alanine N-acetyltransferase n=1 Tax=Halobacillus karajensis TaxID=195088 RepID=A0A024P431_9BACI|nr:GNAT family N-acetyltransferase [Halobacillus karajensis]CDQ18765.1 ribosomal-protein-alanine N-acetyltransferase [Halobacillus karajensis]CDQ23163.1 ribosomal-protein-alanine N-acetyltransferase [Halobacillus karajensis]CDQ26645.1 ribosomal-protein-alanine N-acetyltransferase [Halobacillus karajensis]SEH46524.1 Ribosomal protein S18 acetylase RimI [Halobacillus karajensis]
MDIRELEVKELHTVAKWLFKMNEQDHHYVAWMASDQNEIFEQIWTLTQFKEPLAYVAWEGEEIIGFLGILPFFEQKLCRLLGPFATKDQEKIIERLWDKASLTAQLHFDIVKVACFAANESLVSFTERHRFQMYNIERTLAVHKNGYHPPENKESSIVEVNDEDRRALDVLHPSAAYYTTEEMLNLSKDKGNHLWGYQENGELIGYIYLETILSGQEGEICFVHVAPQHRSSGVGSLLIHHALQYAFYALDLDMVTISVRTENQQAEHLYKQMGFKEIHTIYAYQKEMKPEPPLSTNIH